jgi:hypothetical protein
MGNYPEGVTGLEYEIAGPTGERTGEHEDYCRNEDCALFEEYKDQEGTETWYGSDGLFRWKCERCHLEHEMEIPEYEEYDL